VTTPKLTVSFGHSSNLSEIQRVEQLAWEDFARSLTKTPPETEDKSSVGWYAAAEFEASHRHGKTFVARYALTLDYDHISRTDVAAIRETYKGLAYALYTTWSHRPEKPRVRVVLPLSRPAGADEFQAVSRRIAARFDIEKAAGESHVVAQMMFLPSVKPGEGKTFRAEINDGAHVDVDAVLEEYDDWTDKSTWPHRLEGDGVYNTDDLPVPPNEKPGIVGDFCRAFDIPTAIERFELPYVPTNVQDRWTYTAGSRPEGAIVYDGGLKLHSHHDTDPARGQHNAFDLVRLHKFGGFDGSVAAGIPVTERPSFRAMVALALAQPEVREQQVIDELDDLGPLPRVDVSGNEGGLHSGSVEGHRAEARDVAASRFRVIPAAEFTGGKPLDWIVKGLLPRAQVGVIYGPSTVGKSFVVTDIGAHVSSGRSWRELRTKKGRVVTVVAEGAGGYKQRLQAHSREFSVPMDAMPDVIADAPDLKDPKHAAEIALAIGKADLVIIDTLAASFIGNENSGEDLGLVLRHCKFIHEKTGAMVWLVHHTGKDETKGARGWSGLKAAADVEMEVSQQGVFRTLKLTKLKDGDADRKWGFQLRAVVLGTDEDGDEVSSCVVEAAEILETSGNRPEPRSQWQKDVLKAARKIASSGPVTVQALTDYVMSTLSEPTEAEKGRDRRPFQIRRAIDALLAAGVWLFKHGPHSVTLTRVVEAGEEFDDE
jgi:hypothetical protein